MHFRFYINSDDYHFCRDVNYLCPRQLRYKYQDRNLPVNIDEDNRIWWWVSRNTTQWAYHKFSLPRSERRRNGKIMASCATPRVSEKRKGCRREGKEREREGGRGGVARTPFSAFASAFLVFCLSGKKKLLYGGKARVLPRRRKAERDPRLPPHHPGTLGGPCRLTMRQSDGASQETRYHLPVKPKITWNPRRGVRCVLVYVKGDSPGGVGCCTPVLAKSTYAIVPRTSKVI